jgi:hypothetical protein
MQIWRNGAISHSIPTEDVDSVTFVVAPILEIDHTDNIAFTADATTTGNPVFVVTTNAGSWDAVSNQAWLTVDKSESGFTVSTTPAYIALQRPTGATVTVTAPGTTPITINVTQATKGYPATVYARGVATVGGAAAWLPFNFDASIPGYQIRLYISETGGGVYVYGPNYASWGGPIFTSTSGTSITNTNVMYGSVEANRWIITEAESAVGGCYYNVTINVATMQATFNKELLP